MADTSSNEEEKEASGRVFDFTSARSYKLTVFMCSLKPGSSLHNT